MSVGKDNSSIRSTTGTTTASSTTKMLTRHKSFGKKRGRLSYTSSLYDLDNKGHLTPVEQKARQLDVDNTGLVPPEAVIALMEQEQRSKRRQRLLLLGNIIQWLPVVVMGIYTMIKFTEAQYKQNVGGRVITRDEYIQQGIASNADIEALWSLNDAYPLTQQHLDDYERDGFVVLRQFLNTTNAATLDRIISYNLDELAFPDILTACSRKFHGEFYHSTVTWRFWQQPRISNMLSRLALGGDVPYAVTSEILEMPNSKTCIPQWHWDFLTFPQTYNASYKSGAQIWLSTESVDANMGGGLAFMPGSHKWANDIDDGTPKHECFLMNLFEPLSAECTRLLDAQRVVPTLHPGDIVVFSRFTLHRSVSRNPAIPFESGARKGYTLRLGSAKSIFKQDTMSCFPSHPSSNFQGQLQDGERYDTIIDATTGKPKGEAVYRPMNMGMDDEDMIVGQKSGRAMSISTFLHYSAQTIIRQKIKWKLAKMLEDTVNGLLDSEVLDISCKASPTPDIHKKDQKIS